MESTSDLALRFLQEAPDSPLSFTKKDMSHVYGQIRSKTEHALPKEFELLYPSFEFPAFNVDPIRFFGDLGPTNSSDEVMRTYMRIADEGVRSRWRAIGGRLRVAVG